MVFSSPFFLFAFLPLVLAIYFAAPKRAKNAVLLLASFGFYLVGAGGYILLLFFSITVNYGLGRWLDRAEGNQRKAAVITAVLANMVPLLVYKYAKLAILTGNSVLGWFHVPPLPLPDFFLPAGISFFTFQGLAYVIDVYRREIPACASLIDFALFKSFFPQLVAGPIVRYHHLAHELQHRTHSWAAAEEGVLRFGLGLSKKVLFADNLGRVADRIFNGSPSDWTTGTAWIAALCYTFQIFFDFAGYSDMAIGLGRIFGLSLPENFRQPYLACSVTEFWTRWHMSLSTWFRDYLYIPLGGNRRGTTRTVLNLLVVFFLCGLWHGAAYTFVVWGLFHGFLLLVERILKVRWGLVPRGWAGRALTFGLVIVGWVVFRATSLDQVHVFLSTMAGLHSAPSPTFDATYYLTNNVVVYLAFAIICAFWPERSLLPRQVEPVLRAIRPPAILGLTALAIVAQAPQSFNPFIYFQF